MSFDPPADNAAWRTDKGFTFELWTDTDRTLALRYGAAAAADQSHASRRTVLLDANGDLARVYDVRGTGLGTHPEDVLEDAIALFGAKPAPAP